MTRDTAMTGASKNHDSKSDRRPGLGLGGVFLIGAAAAHWPLDIAATHLSGVGHLERLVGVILGFWVMGLVICWALIRLGINRAPAVHTVFLSMVMVVYGGKILYELGRPIGWLILLSTIGLAGFVFARFGDHRLINALVVGLAIALMAGPAISLYRSWQEWGVDTVVTQVPLEMTIVDKPDIFVVVLDGYPGSKAFEIDGGQLSEELTDELEGQGFQIPDSAWSSYWETSLSIPSLLEMSYPVVDNGGGGATTRSLHNIISGDNRLVEILHANDYETTMIESGWSGSSCGPAYDNCVVAPLLDETMFFTLENTIAGPYIFDAKGYSFTVGARRTMRWLLDNAAQISSSTRPQMVFAHLMAPHPPFFLDGECATTVSQDRSGVEFYIPDVDRSDRESYFQAQLVCLNGFMAQLAGLVAADDVVVFVSDHGTDRRFQLSLPPARWDEEATTERMNVFAAVRTGNQCKIPDAVINPNLMRAVLSCISNEELDLLEARMWKRGMVEIDAQQLASLLEGSESS